MDDFIMDTESSHLKRYRQASELQQKSMTLGRMPHDKRQKVSDFSTRLTSESVSHPPPLPKRTSSFRNQHRVKLSVNHEGVQAADHSLSNSQDNPNKGKVDRMRQQLLQNLSPASQKPIVSKVSHQTIQDTGQQGFRSETEAKVTPKAPPRAAPKPTRSKAIVKHESNESIDRPGENKAVKVPRRMQSTNLFRSVSHDISSSSDSPGSSGDGQVSRKKTNSCNQQLGLSTSKLSVNWREQTDLTTGTCENQQHIRSNCKSALQEHTHDNLETPVHSAISEQLKHMHIMKGKPRTGLPTGNVSQTELLHVEHKSFPVSAIKENATKRMDFGLNKSDEDCFDEQRFSQEPRITEQEQHLEWQNYIGKSRDSERDNLSSHDQGDHLLLQPMLTCKFLSSHSHMLPTCVNVHKGVVNSMGDLSIAQDERFVFHFVKQTKVVVMHDRQKKVQCLVPINSSQKFGIVYESSGSGESVGGLEFPTAGDIIAAKPLPYVVRATRAYDGGSSDKSVQENELLFIRGTSKGNIGRRTKLLKVQTIDNVNKYLSSKCAGEFTTKPGDVQLYLSTIIDRSLPLPLKAVLYPDPEIKPYLPASLVFDIVLLERLSNSVSVVCTTCDGTERSVIEISGNLRLQIQPVHTTTREKLEINSLTEELRTNFNPRNVTFHGEGITSKASELQNLLFCQVLDGVEAKGIELYSPSTTPLPQEVRDTLDEIAVSLQHQPETTSCELGSYDDDEGSMQSTDEDSHNAGNGVDAQDDEDEDGMYETIESAFADLPQEEAERLQKLSEANIATMKSKISSIFKRSKDSVHRAPTSPKHEQQQQWQQESLSQASSQDEYDSISYLSGDVTIQDRPLPTPTDINTAHCNAQFGSQCSISTTSSAVKSDDYEGVQFSEDSAAAEVSKTPPSRIHYQLHASPQSTHSKPPVPEIHKGKPLRKVSASPFSEVLQSASNFERHIDRVLPDQNWTDSTNMKQLTDKLEKQVASLEEELALLKSHVKKVANDIEEIQKDTLDRKAQESQQLTLSHRMEENRRVVANMDELKVQQLLDGMDMRAYKKSFSHQRINGEVLLECDEDILRTELNVTSRLHCKKLMLLISGKKSVYDFVNF